MRILQLGKAYPPVNLGGVEITIKLFNEGLHDRGIKCDVLGVNDKVFSQKEKFENGVIYRESCIVKLFSTLISVKLIYRLFKIRNFYDIIHVHHPDPMSALAIWVVRPKGRIILHWHSDILKQKKLLFLFKPIQNWLLNRSTKIITTSKKYANESIFLKSYLHKVVYLPIGVNINELVYSEELKLKILNDYIDKKIILAVGRFSYYKGYKYLIKSLMYLKDNYHLVIVGNGNLDEESKSIIDQFDLKNRVSIKGKLDDLEKNSYISACDIFVLPSIYKTEAYGIVQIEAMAFGKPIVSTKIPGSGVDWVNKNMVSGMTVEIKNSLELANAIHCILSNAELSNQLGRGAKSRYLKYFTKDKMIDDLIGIYKNVLNK